MRTRFRSKSIVRVVAVATMLLAVGTVAAARFAPSIAVIDGGDVIGGDPDKFSCNNLCKQNAGPGCIATAGVTCGQNNVNQVCGEKIDSVKEVKGCEVNPAGNVDPCSNDRTPKPCYTGRNCACWVDTFNGQLYYSCKEVGNANDRGNTVGSTNCR